ncbi:5-oxoprolinase subunit PxpB [Deferrisoma camini]|uniref:5-oxoprolinase subunit PxpB n=1 Tax=Deferrisoma camini TaxID=1035120 RepID=UPI00046D5E9E|nr:5-oxoprolinase subunit PxpB [Deferrisoma camini]
MTPAPWQRPRILPCGETALTVEVGDAIAPEIHERVVALARALEGIRGVIARVPTYRSVFVEYDPLEVSYEALALEVERAWSDLTRSPPRASSPRVIEIPVCYDPEFGPDLAEVARRHGLTPAEVVEIHTAPAYRVYMLGFMPGFLFLGGLSPRIHTPRRAEPRARVPAGSVGIAGPQTGVYSLDSPGGWQIIGRTPLRMFDPQRQPPARAVPGMGVRFRPIDAATFRAMKKSKT